MDYPGKRASGVTVNAKLRPRPWRRSAALGQERARQAPLSGTFCACDQRQIDDVPLGVAAPDADRIMADGEDRFDRLRVVAASKSERAVDEATADLGRHLPIVA